MNICIQHLVTRVFKRAEENCFLSRHLSLSLKYYAVYNLLSVIAPDFVSFSHTTTTKTEKRQKEKKKGSSVIGIFLKFLVFAEALEDRSTSWKISVTVTKCTCNIAGLTFGHRPLA